MDLPELPQSKPDDLLGRRNRSKDSRPGAHTLHVLPGDKRWELYPTNAEKRAINYWDKSLHDVVMSAGALSLLVAMFTVISLNLQSSRANYWATILQGSHTFAPADAMAQRMMRWATRLFVSCLSLCMLVACLALCAKHQLTKHQWQAQGNGSAYRLSHVTWRQRVVIARLRRSGMPSIITFLWRLLCLAFLIFCSAVVLFLLPLDLMLSGMLLGIMLLMLVVVAISVVMNLYQRERPSWMPVLICRELSAEISDMKPMNRGIFSTVHQGVLKRDDQEELVAVKEIRTTGMDPGVVSRRFRREIRVWSTLKHRYILPIYGVHISSNDELPALVSPWCIKGNLNDYIKERRRGKDPMIDLCLVKGGLKEVLSAIAYLHGQNPPIVHGDLKGNNILVAMDGRIQLADFGLSLIQAEHGNLMSTDPAGKGTLPFMSCELLEHDAPTVHSDMWALSCVFVEMVSGCPPYHDKPTNKGKMLAILNGEFPSRPGGVSDELWGLVSINWNKDPHERLSAECMLSRLLTLKDAPGRPSLQNMPE